MEKSKCFIIMPISTPKESLELYSNDKDHFTHALELLFIPALEKIGIEPIKPIVKGSEVIHGDIIKNIETCEFVLCDMSILNPNVFFELGIRTAVNKPVSLIKDDVTSKVPFDTSIINYHTYNHLLNAWELESEIDKLSIHLNDSFKSPDTENSLWKYFSLSSKAQPIESPSSSDDKIDYLAMQVQGLRKELEASNRNYPTETSNIDLSDDDYIIENNKATLYNQIVELAGKENTKVYSVWGEPGNSMIIYSNKTLSHKMQRELIKMADYFGIKLIFKVRNI